MLKKFYKKDSTNWVVRATVEGKDFIKIQAGDCDRPRARSKDHYEESGPNNHDIRQERVAPAS